jgi:alpha-D-xyloside xylohydrolase
MPVFVRPGTEIPIYFDEVECTDQMDLGKAGVLTVDEEFGGIEF